MHKKAPPESEGPVKFLAIRQWFDFERVVNKLTKTNEL